MPKRKAVTDTRTTKRIRKTDVIPNLDPRLIHIGNRHFIQSVCEKLDSQSLSNFVRSSKVVRDVCQKVLNARKEHEKNQIQATRLANIISKQVVKNLDAKIKDIPNQWIHGLRGRISRFLRSKRKIIPQDIKERIKLPLSNILNSGLSDIDDERYLKNELYRKIYTDKAINDIWDYYNEEFFIFNPPDIESILSNSVDEFMMKK